MTMMVILGAIAIFVVFIVYLFGRTEKEKEEHRKTCYREEEPSVITDSSYCSVPGNIYHSKFYHGDSYHGDS